MGSVAPWLRSSKVAIDPLKVSLDKAHYITDEEVIALMQKDPSKLLIIDVRNEDAKGGHIKSAIHFPDNTFRDALKEELIDLIRKRTPSMIVVHCMASMVRGPRCAYRLREQLTQLRLTEPSLPDPNIVRVLEGGADQWVIRFWCSEPSLIEDFDIAEWPALAPDASNAAGGTASGPTSTVPAAIGGAGACASISVDTSASPTASTSVANDSLAEPQS